MLYKGLPVEQARQGFEELKGTPSIEPIEPVVRVRRKLRIPAGQQDK